MRNPRTPAGVRGFPGTGAVGSGLAGELLAERLQGLVGSERALDGSVVLRLRLRGVRRGLAGLDVGRLGLLDLLLVGLPARVGLGVLPLPLLALSVEALEPLARLRVEAVGVDLVTLVVVRRRHAVERRVEVVRHGVHTLGGLLQRQRDPATLEVDVDDLDHDVVVDLDDLLRDLDVTLGELGDVHQTLDALLDPDERAERNQLGDLAGHDLAHLVGPGELLPRVFLGRLQRQRDALAVHVDVQHLDGDLLADLDDLGRVVDVLPGQLRHVHQAVDAAEVHERTEVDDARDDALADLALLQLGEEVHPHLGLRLLQPRPARQDHVVAVLVELDDLGLDLLADVRLEITDAAHLDQRRRKEAAKTDVEDEAALDDLDDGAGDDAVLLLDLLDRAPRLLVLSALLGQDQTAFLVLLLEDQGLDVVADVDDVVRVDVVLDRQLARRDDALGLVTDVEQDLVPVDFDDGAFDDVAVVEVLDGLIDRREEVFLRPDVIDRNLRGVLHCGVERCLDAGRHVVSCSVDWNVVAGCVQAAGSHRAEGEKLSPPTVASTSLLRPRSRGPIAHLTEYGLRRAQGNCAWRQGVSDLLRILGNADRDSSSVPLALSVRRLSRSRATCVVRHSQNDGRPAARSPVRAVARSRSSAASATGFRPARDASSTSAHRSAARARSTTSSSAPGTLRRTTSSTAPASTGSSQNRSRLPRSVKGEPACANSQSTRPVIVAVSGSTSRFFGLKSLWHRQTRSVCAASASASARTADSRSASSGGRAIAAACRSYQVSRSAGPNGTTSRSPSPNSPERRNGIPLSMASRSPSCSPTRRRRAADAVPRKVPRLTPGSRSVSTYGGSSGVPSGFASSTRGTGSSPRTSRSRATSTAARSGRRR